MKPQAMIAVVVLVVAAGAVLVLKSLNKPSDAGQAAAAAEYPPPAVDIPRLIDIGAGKCIPCKMMAPILAELKKEFVGRMDVVVIDITEHPEASRVYGINLIPTQLFYDASGKEIFRHEGFMPKEDILARWKELGFDFQKEVGK